GKSTLEMSRRADRIVVSVRHIAERCVRRCVVWIDRKRLLLRLPGTGITLLAVHQAHTRFVDEVRGQPLPRRGITRIDFEYLPQKRVGLRVRLGRLLPPEFPGL